MHLATKVVLVLLTVVGLFLAISFWRVRDLISEDRRRSSTGD
jgi:hypothetical protein